MCAFVESDKSGLSPISKEALLFLIHFTAKTKGVNDIISEVVADFRKNHIKRLELLKREFSPDDWDLISTNSSYISYIVCPVCATNTPQILLLHLNYISQRNRHALRLASNAVVSAHSHRRLLHTHIQQDVFSKQRASLSLTSPLLSLHKDSQP